MHFIFDSINYILIFIALYFEVFVLISYLESRGARAKIWALPRVLPSVTVMVPCWNEEKTISATIHSLLKLRYPSNKLSIFIIDDGSTDGSWKMLNDKFSRKSQVTLFHKENGGKASALNYGLRFVQSDLVGCLDADSFVYPETLKKIVARFSDKETMAVTPSIKVHNPKNIIELIQKVEYSWGVLFRNILSHLGAMYITPGPLSIFRKEVFDKLGGYREAHKTEDMELALRMQEAGYKIANVPDAFVSTVAPRNIKVLYRQRLRWTYGFLKNTIDYRHMLGNPKYGNLGLVILPIAAFSIFSSLYLVLSTIFGWIIEGFAKIAEIRTIGLNFSWPSFDLFYVNTGVLAFAGLVGLFGTLLLLYFARKLAEEKFGLGIIYFLVLYVFLTPLWVSRAIFNVAFSRNTNWR